MKKIVKKVVYYQCQTCLTDYSKAAEARRCDRRITEKKLFSVGDRVRGLKPCVKEKRQRQYEFQGKVVRIIGPQRADYEYEEKWLGAKLERLKSHVYQYEVEFHCPKCQEKNGDVFYAPELRAIKRL